MISSILFAFPLLSPLKKGGLFIRTNLVEIGPVVLEKKMKMRTVNDDDNNNDDNNDDDNNDGQRTPKFFSTIIRI